MPFYHQPGIIFQDQSGNIYNFSYNDGEITYIFFDKLLGKTKKGIIGKKMTNDFDGEMNSLGEIYLIYKEEEGKVVLASSPREFLPRRTIIERNPSIQNLNLCFVEDQIHIFYCIPEGNHGVYKIMHQFENGESWSVQEACTLTKGQILNPILPLVKKNKIQLFYYDFIGKAEQLFIKIYDCKKENWGQSQQITSSEGEKLYFDALQVGNQLHITYCEYVQENFIVKYVKYLIEGENYKKILEQEISNPANCQYPTLIYYGRRLWLCWTEYNYIVSKYSNDEGIHWSEIYLYNESKKEDIIRYKYSTNEENNILLNYSFGKVKNLQFVGFGNLDNTTKIPLKKEKPKTQITQKSSKFDFSKEKEEEKEQEQSLDLLKKEEEKEQEQSLDLLKKEMEKIERKLKTIENKIGELQGKNENQEEKREKGKRESKKIEDRLTIVEDFLLQNTRGFKYFIKKIKK